MRLQPHPYPYKRYYTATYADATRLLSQDANEYDQLTENADEANRTYQLLLASHRATTYHHEHTRHYNAPALFAIDVDARDHVVQITRIDREEG